MIVSKDVLVRAVDLKLITKAEAKMAYEAMLPYGSSLPIWAAAASSAAGSASAGDHQGGSGAETAQMYQRCLQE